MKYPTETIKAFKDAAKAFDTAAAALLKVEAHKLDESEDKFLRIRAVRAEHINREIQSGKSQRS